MARRDAAGGPVVCFSCGQPGHHIRDCQTACLRRAGPNKGGVAPAVSAARPAQGGGRGNAPAAAAAGAGGVPLLEQGIHLGHTLADAQKRIKQLMILLTPDYLSLTQLSSALLEDLRAHQLQEFVCSTLLHCVKCLPQKSGVFVGLLCALRIQLHKDNPEACSIKSLGSSSTGAPLPQGPDQLLHVFLGQLGTALLEACAAGAWDELRLLVRFVAGLGSANLIPLDNVWEAVERLHALQTEAGEGGADVASLMPASQREYLLYMLVSIVPFLAEHYDDERFAQLQKRIEALMSTRRVQRRGHTDLLSITGRMSEGGAKASSGDADESKMEDVGKSSSSSSAAAASSSSSSSAASADDFSFDLLDCWLSSLQGLTSKEAYLSDASEVSIQRSSYQLFRTELDNLCKPLPFECAQLITLPAGPSPRLRPILRLFPRGPGVALPSAGGVLPLNDLLIGDYISDLLCIFVALHKEGTKQLLSLPLPLSEAARQNGQWLLIETILSNLFTLPQPNVRALFYGTIFIDLFKAQPNLMPPLLGAAINALFHRLSSPGLDLELTERFLDWFTFHLSNFAYVWPWTSWSYVLDQSDTHPQRSFVSRSLALCVRLSYWERIQQVIPEEFLPLMPPQPHPAFRFSAKNIASSAGDLNVQQYHQLSLDLLKMIQAKASANVIVGWMDAQVTPVLGAEARLRLFTPCLLECGNQSYSHMIALLDRYKTVFSTLCSTTPRKRLPGEAEDAPLPLLSPFDCQRLIVHSLSEYWQHSAQHLVVLSEQLYVHGIISAASVVAWVFFAQRHPERHAHLWSGVLFALLKHALAALQTRVDTVLHKPRTLALQSAERRADDAKLIESLLLERRELLVSVCSNFQKLLSELAKRREAAGSKERERARVDADQHMVLQRFAHFARTFSTELSAVLPYLHEVVPKSSPLSDLVAQIPTLL